MINDSWGPLISLAASGEAIKNYGDIDEEVSQKYIVSGQWNHKKNSFFGPNNDTC